MKKIILATGLMLCAITAQAQECGASATLNQNFTNFTVGTNGVFPQSCWNTIAGGYPVGPSIYTEEVGSPANRYVTFNTGIIVNTNAYLITPQLATLDGDHELSFSTWKIAQNGEVPAGIVTVTVGTITDADASTFLALDGSTYTITSGSTQTYDHIVVPAGTPGNRIAFRLSADTANNALAIDDVSWEQLTDCQAVSAIDEDFAEFIPTVTLPFHCWSGIANGTTLTTGITGGSITFDSSQSANSPAYLVAPIVATFDGNHRLKFDANKTTDGTVTLQTGYLVNPNDQATFVAVGDPITLTGSVANYNIMYPVITIDANIAFKFTGTSANQAAVIDNVIYEMAPCEAVATINENFVSFIPTVVLPYHCWSSISGTLPEGPAITTGITGGSLTYDAGTSNATPAYLVTPEVATTNGSHHLNFSTTLTSSNAVTLQPGYIMEIYDAETFVAVGDPITLSEQNETTSNVVTYPALQVHAHLAMKFTGAANNAAVVIDNVVWDDSASTDGFIQNNFTLYPNPASGSVNINTNGSEGVVGIYSTTGNKVLETAVSSDNQNIDVSALSAGLYIVRYTGGAVSATQKLIVR